MVKITKMHRTIQIVIICEGKIWDTVNAPHPISCPFPPTQGYSAFHAQAIYIILFT